MTGQTCQQGLSGGNINFLLSVGFRGWGEDTKRMQIRPENSNSSVQIKPQYIICIQMPKYTLYVHTSDVFAGSTHIDCRRESQKKRDAT